MSSQFKPAKVTPDKFAAIKKAMRDTGMTRSQLSRQFGVGRTTLQTINRCGSYDDYKAFLAQQLQRKNQARQETFKKGHAPVSKTATPALTQPTGEANTINTYLDLRVSHRRTLWELLVIAFYDVCVALVILLLLCLAGSKF